MTARQTTCAWCCKYCPVHGAVVLLSVHFAQDCCATLLTVQNISNFFRSSILLKIYETWSVEVLVFGLNAFTPHFKSAQRCSTGFRSGLFSGHSGLVIPFLCLKSFTTFARCAGALLSWNVMSSSGKNRLCWPTVILSPVILLAVNCLAPPIIVLV